MGKPISALMRQRLNQQKAALSGGMIINMKTWTKGRIRCLPVPPAEPTPGIKYVGLYSKAIAKGTTSPAAFGKPCPVLDKLAEKKQGMTADEKKELGGVCNINVEYWMPVIHREDAGDASAPKLKILPCKKGPYKQIVDYMIADEAGEDITDPDEGRDFLYQKDGSGQASEYSIPKFYDSSPLSDDAEYMANALKAHAGMDVQARFWPVDWDVLEQIYQMLSDGEPIPDHYKQQFDGPAGAADPDDEDLHEAIVGAVKVNPPAPPPAAAKAAGKTAAVKVAAPPPPPPPADDAVSQEVEVGSTVSFPVGEEIHTGVVQTVADEPADDGDTAMDVLSDSDGGVYGVWVSMVTVLAPPAVEEAPESPDVTEAAEPEEVPPTPPPKVAAPKAPVKPPVPAAKAPVKPPVPAKPAAAPKAPVKPPVPAKPAASQAIAGKLATMKK